MSEPPSCRRRARLVVLALYCFLVLLAPPAKPFAARPAGKRSSCRRARCSQQRTSLGMSSESGASEDATKLREAAARIRAEVEELEKSASPNRKPIAVAVPSLRPAAQFPLTIRDSCWRIKMEIAGTKEERGLKKSPVQVSFSCQLQDEDNIVVVEENNKYIERGFVWSPDRESDKVYVAFDVRVVGLGLVPDGKIYLNARVDQTPDGRYSLADGVVTIKQVQQGRGFGFFSFAGILAEFKVVGSFEATPIAAV